MASKHFGVMLGEDILARVFGVAAKNVVTRDPLWLDELHRFEVLGKMNKAKFCSRWLKLS